MAAPSSKSLRSLSGHWSLSSLSDDFSPVLERQGTSWATRTTLTSVSITLSISQYDDADKVHHIDIGQSATGAGIAGNTERWIFNERSNDTDDPFFGMLKTEAKWVKKRDVEDLYLKHGWEGDDDLVFAASRQAKEGGWIARQVWGFQNIDGDRYWCRKIVVTGGGQGEGGSVEGKEEVRMVYDWQGES